MKFERLGKKRKPYQGVYCDHKTTHPKHPKAAHWEGTWLGWPLGLFCTECKKEWETMKAEYDGS